MPVFKFAENLLGNEVNNNIMAGSKFEFLPRNGVVRVYAAQDPPVGAENVNIDFTLGNVVIGDDLPCNFVATDALGPNRNTDLLATGVAAAGDRIQIRAQETGGVTQDYRVLVEINEL